MESSFPKPHIGMKKKWTCIGRDFGIVKYDSDTPSEYQEPPTGEWWGPSHPDFGTAVGKKHTVGMVEPLLGTSKTGGLGTFRKPVYKTGLTSVPKFYNWFHTDIRPINKAAKTPINIEVPIELEMVWTASGWEYDSKGQFFPLDKKGFNKGSSSTFHNYHFTVECWKRFIYEGGEKIVFSGDDDTWIYINNQLVIDLGGIHNAMSATYDVDAVAGLKKGDAYDLSLFHAERHAKGIFFVKFSFCCFTTLQHCV
jgi:fibro-slime domain-containing protein